MRRARWRNVLDAISAAAMAVETTAAATEAAGTVEEAGNTKHVTRFFTEASR